MKKFKNILSNICKYMAYTFLAFLIAICIYTFFETGIRKKDYVNIFGYTYFVVASESMSGTIELGDAVIVKLDDTYKEDDIITFKSNNTFITHRVIKILDDRVITQGDVNNVEDDPVLKDKIVGKVVFIISISFVLKLIGILIIIFVIFTLINFDSIFKKYIAKEKTKTKKEEPSLEYTQEIKLIKNDTDKEKYELFQKMLETLEIDTLTSVTNDDIEVLQDVEEEEEDFFNIVLKILKLKHKKMKKIRITNEWLEKFRYVYKLAHILLLEDSCELLSMMKEVPFTELYNYDFEEIGFYQNVQDKLYDMPIYIYIKVLIYCILYSDEHYFDAVFKVLKFRIRIDKKYTFFLNNKKEIVKKRERSELKNLISYMEKVAEECEDKDAFNLESIAKYVKSKKVVNKL